MDRIRDAVRTEAQGSTPATSASILRRVGINATDQIFFRLQQQIPTAVSGIRPLPHKQVFTGLQIELETCISAAETFGEVNARPPGFLNDRLQSVKRLMRRSLSWYTRPLRLFHGAVIRTLQQFLATLETQQAMLSDRALQKNLLAAEKRLDDVEQGTYEIYQLTQSAIERFEAQNREINDELKALRTDLHDLNAELDSLRQRLKEPMPG